MNETGEISVSRLNLMIAEAIRKDPRIRDVTVRGEVSGFRNHLASGHWYFSLKDADSAVSCVMFRQNTFHARLRPRDGDSVVVTGYVDVYPKNGSYQLYAMSMRPAGTGDLHLQLEELKRKLSAEGLFDPARKRVLPMKPRKCAVVTSASGAAWRDILNVSGMRCPGVPIVLVPVTVQGERAAAEIAEGIRKAGEMTGADVVIVARGGGSAEDLWCFNDEKVARAVAACPVPVVSGVGHETDTTLCDLAADMRAATPSNAAEIVFPNRRELAGRTGQLRTALRRAAENALAAKQAALRESYIRLSAASPEKKVASLTASAALLREKLLHAARMRLEAAAAKAAPLKKGLEDACGLRMREAGEQIRRTRERLEAISPMGVLERGYTMVTDPLGRVLTDTGKARAAGDLVIRFSDGTLEAAVKTDGGRKTDG